MAKPSIFTLSMRERVSIFTVREGQAFWGNVPLKMAKKYRLGQGLIIIEQGAKWPLLSRLSKKGRLDYKLSLPEDGDYSVGPNFGHRIREPREERDPIKRLLMRAGVAIARLQVMSAGEDLPISIFSCDIQRACQTGTKRVYFETDGQALLDRVKHEKMPDSSWEDAVTQEGIIQGATWAIKRYDLVNIGQKDMKYARIDKVYVWPACTVQVLAQALKLS